MLQLLHSAIPPPLSEGWDMATTDDEQNRAAVMASLNAIEIFTKERPTMPLQYLRALMYVYLFEGKSVRELATMCGVAPSVMSRHLLDLGESNRHLEPGMQLVTTTPNPKDRRSHLAKMTPKGRDVMRNYATRIRQVRPSR